MKEKPIVFSTPMVQAILDGRKTQTRRVIKPQPPELANIVLRPILQESIAQFWGIGTSPICDARCRYQPSDILWVRETWCPYDNDHIIDNVKYVYRADATPNSEDARKAYGYRWHPSIHMPRAAARIFLRVIGVKVERVLEISESDAIAEGIENPQSDGYNWGKFSTIWDSINAKRDGGLYAWEKNPWVWVCEFERINKPNE